MRCLGMLHQAPRRLVPFSTGATKECERFWNRRISYLVVINSLIRFPVTTKAVVVKCCVTTAASCCYCNTVNDNGTRRVFGHYVLELQVVDMLCWIQSGLTFGGEHQVFKNDKEFFRVTRTGAFWALLFRKLAFYERFGAFLINVIWSPCF